GKSSRMMSVLDVGGGGADFTGCAGESCFGSGFADGRVPGLTGVACLGALGVGGASGSTESDGGGSLTVIVGGGAAIEEGGSGVASVFARPWKIANVAAAVRPIAASAIGIAKRLRRARGARPV